MKKTINIKNIEEAEVLLNAYKKKKYSPIDIRLTNTHLKKINDYIHIDLFSKNDLFVNSDTLYDIMQPIGGKRRHNYHGLTPIELVEVFYNLVDPYCLYITDLGRLGIISTITSESGFPLISIIEIGAGLIGNVKANINKMVTLYPKDNLKRYLKSRKVVKVLYINEKKDPEKKK